MSDASADRWAAERVIKISTLHPHERLILFVLLQRTTAGTLTIRPQHTPSFTALVRETGLGRGTLAKYLNQLEDSGWLRRDRPTTRAALRVRSKTNYVIQLPESLVRELNRYGSRTSPDTELVDEESQVGTSTGAGPVREPDGSSSGAEHNSETTSKPSSTKKVTGGSGGRSRSERATVIPGDFEITDQMRGEAPEKYPLVDIEYETEQLRDYYAATRKRYVDWNAVWRQWMRRAQKQASERRGRSNGWNGDNGRRRNTSSTTNPNHSEEAYLDESFG